MYIIRESYWSAQGNLTGTINNRRIQLLVYADDVDVIGQRKEAVVETFNALEIAVKVMELNINYSKTIPGN